MTSTPLPEQGGFNEKLDAIIVGLQVSIGKGLTKSSDLYKAKHEAKQAILDWHNKQVEEVLDRLLREYELDIQSKWFSSSGGMVDLSSAIEAERERLGK